jgi:predicted nucleic acid-binding protein
VRVVVVDASALLEYILRTELTFAIAPILRDPDISLQVPALCDVEVTSGLRRALLRKTMATPRALLALEDYLRMPLTRHGHQSLLSRTLDLRPNFSSYDATYVSLAEKLEGELLTSDNRLAAATRAHTSIHVLP